MWPCTRAPISRRALHVGRNLESLREAMLPWTQGLLLRSGVQMQPRVLALPLRHNDKQTLHFLECICGRPPHLRSVCRFRRTLRTPSCRGRAVRPAILSLCLKGLTSSIVQGQSTCRKLPGARVCDLATCSHMCPSSGRRSSDAHGAELETLIGSREALRLHHGSILLVGFGKQCCSHEVHGLGQAELRVLRCDCPQQSSHWLLKCLRAPSPAYVVLDDAGGRVRELQALWYKSRVDAVW